MFSLENVAIVFMIRCQGKNRDKPSKQAMFTNTEVAWNFSRRKVLLSIFISVGLLIVVF